AEDGIRDATVTGVQTCALPILTQKMIDNLRLSIYWKRGVDLRPAKSSKLLNARVDRINPYATALAAELPPRYEWSYDLSVSSAEIGRASCRERLQLSEAAAETT